MIVMPAIDLIGGRCVRLAQGRFDDAIVYPDDPARALAGFAEAGAEWAHIVDLDGARAGRPMQHDLIARLAAEARLKLQVAGGFRDAASVRAALAAGAARVVIGSLAARDPKAVRAIIAEEGADRIAIALDVNIVEGAPVVATSGWMQSSGRTLYEAAAALPEARHLLVTDISRDGMLRGPNVALMREIAVRLPTIALQASGGVSGLADLAALAEAGAAAAIVGKALWEGRIGLPEALRHARA